MIVPIFFSSSEDRKSMATPPVNQLSSMNSSTTIGNVSDADMVKAYNFRISNPNMIILTPGVDAHGLTTLQISWGSVSGAQEMVNLLKTMNVFQ
jgi:hypothetical protein